ncbi:MAG: very short patch repair endonuclease [Bacteroidota bacterium]|nr:very short patch repair endonuclease [Bacteroidota bacterium]
MHRFLHANGFRYKLHYKSLPRQTWYCLPGPVRCPPADRNGCFWHGHEG